MKYLIFAAVVIAALMPCQTARANDVTADLEAPNVRTWSNRAADDGSMHCMGNGDMIAYACGADVPYVYGPPYSSPNLLSLTTSCDREITDAATRENGTAIWHHNTSLDGHLALQYIEFVAAGAPAYVRQVDCSAEGVSWVIHPHPGCSFAPVKTRAGVWIQSIQPGQAIFRYPSNMWSHQWISVQGACHGEIDSSGALVIKCLQGRGSLMIVSAPELPRGTALFEKASAKGVEALLGDTRQFWHRFTARRLAAVPAGTNSDPKIAEALDGAAVLLKCQQSSTGGIMAGPYFPMAYIRDQYGAARGMLALGMTLEAKMNLAFRYDKFKRFGGLVTADLMGTNCARHQHEEDDVEGTAYTILQVRDYVNATTSNTLARKLWPMLKWCWDVQQPHVANGLLPFNGDETYVAGGFYPRSGLLQGSADTTLVCAEAGEWLCKWALAQGLWSASEVREQTKHLAIVRGAYKHWFVDEDRIWANAPERENVIDPPRFRHGVCEGGCGWFGWTQRSATGRYECPYCLATKDLPEEKPGKIEVNSVSLLPAYIGSDIISKSQLSKVVSHVVDQANAAGHISSVPGTEGCVGYDPGLILLSAVKCGHPAANQAKDRLLRMLDSAGAWNEYYNAEDEPRAGCCRCRPWESGVNAAALVAYVRAHRAGK